MDQKKANENTIDWIVTLVLPAFYLPYTLWSLWGREDVNWQPQWVDGLFELTLFSRFFLALLVIGHWIVCWVYCLTYSFTDYTPQDSYVSFCNAILCTMVVVSCIFSSGSVPWLMATFVKTCWVICLVNLSDQKSWSYYCNTLIAPLFYQLVMDLIFVMPLWAQIGIWILYVWWYRDVILETSFIIYSRLVKLPRIN